MIINGKVILRSAVLFASFATVSVAFAKGADVMAPVVDVTQTAPGSAQVPPPEATGTAEAPTTGVSAAANNPQQGALNPLVAPASNANLPVPQRVSRLEQQMSNMVRMNLPQQVSQLQEQIQQLSGQLQVQEHNLKLLNTQQRNFYQDLNQQIARLKSTIAKNGGNDGAVTNKQNLVSNTSQMSETNVYNAAFSQLRKKQYEKAQVAFQGYLSKFPSGRFVANAHYWLGELYLLQKNNEQALMQFNTVVKKYPKSNKVADAKLKLAIIHANLGKVAQARNEFRKIKKGYPGTTAAQLASIQLQQLKLSAKKVNSE